MLGHAEVYEESEDYMKWWADTDEQAAHNKGVAGRLDAMW